MSKYYEKGKKAKELVGIYKNPYRKGTYEYDEWKLGFEHGIHQPLQYDVPLNDCSDFIDEYEPHYTEPKIIKK